MPSEFISHRDVDRLFSLMDAVGLNPTFAEPDGVVDVNLAPLHAILIPRLEVVLLSLLDAMFVDFQPLLWTVPERLSSPALPAGARFGWERRFPPLRPGTCTRRRFG